jgi:hypothetical protein
MRWQMREHRTAARWFAGLLVVGTVVLGAIGPAQADTGWNGTTARLGTHQMRPADTGWNGT